MQKFACLKARMGEVVDCVLRSLHGLLGQRCWLVLPRLQQAKHATIAKHLVNWDWSVFTYSDTNVVFHFLDSGLKK